MNSNKFRRPSSILKALAIIIGVFGIYYGLILGVFGAGPDGPEAPFRWRLFGLAQLLLGALYLVPNSKLTSSRRLSYIYLGLTISPVLVILVITTISITGSSLQSFMDSWGLVVASTYLVACLFAPLSLMLAMLEKRRRT